MTLVEQGAHTVETGQGWKSTHKTGAALLAAVVTSTSFAIFPNRAASYDASPISENTPSSINQPAYSGIPISEKIIGVYDDNLKKGTVEKTVVLLRQIKNAGFNTIKVSLIIDPRYKELSDVGKDYLNQLDNLMKAARLTHLKVVLMALHDGWDQFKTPAPRTPKQISNFCAIAAQEVQQYKDVITATEFENEPDLAYMQGVRIFAKDGQDAVAGPLMRLYARCYDDVKEVAPNVQVWGGNFASRGKDSPNLEPISISPIRMIRDMCVAAKKIVRNRPYFDVIDFHSYTENGASQGQIDSHPTTVTVMSLNRGREAMRCFQGTSQPYNVPTIVGEVGIPTVGSKDISNPEENQANEVSIAMKVALCDPNNMGEINFQWRSDPGNGWKAGEVDYNGRLKPSFWAARKIALAVRAGQFSCNN